MGYALIWTEGLAVALLCLALAVAWAARGGRLRRAWVAVVGLQFLAPAALAVLASGQIQLHDGRFEGNVIRTTWFWYTLAWLTAFALGTLYLLRQGLRRTEAGLAPAAAAWPRARLWSGLAVAALLFVLTFWNQDLAVGTELAIGRQEAGAVLLSMTPPPVPDSENAARVYAQALQTLGEPVQEPWRDAAARGLDARHPADWKAPYVAALVKKHAETLALLRKAAAMPRCSFDHERSLLDAVIPHDRKALRLRDGADLLAVDARVAALEGDLKRACADVTAILRTVRHLEGYLPFGWHLERMAWRTLEDVLRLAPPGKELPALVVPEPVALVRQVRGEQALLGMIFPVAASDPAAFGDRLRRGGPGGGAARLIETLLVPPARVFVAPDDLAAMRRLFEEYREAPRSARDETPRDWAELRQSVENDPTSIYGAIYIKPKQRVLAADVVKTAALRPTARAGLAVAAYRSKHGRYPERLEQLVPEFLPAVPVDPRDGQPLRLLRSVDALILAAPQDVAAVEGGKLTHPGERWPPPVFRLFSRDGKK